MTGLELMMNLSSETTAVVSVRYIGKIEAFEQQIILSMEI